MSACLFPEVDYHMDSSISGNGSSEQHSARQLKLKLKFAAVGKKSLEPTCCVVCSLEPTCCVRSFAHAPHLRSKRDVFGTVCPLAPPRLYPGFMTLLLRLHEKYHTDYFHVLYDMI